MFGKAPQHHKLFLLLLYNSNFAIIVNCNVNISVFWLSLVTSVKGLFNP